MSSGVVPANNEFRNLGFAYTPQNGKMTFFDNDGAYPFPVGTQLPLVNLSPGFSVRNTTAVARTLSLDYIAAFDQR